MEKADVLELAVKHLKNINQQNSLVAAAHLKNKESFANGFKHCTSEAVKYIGAVPGVDITISKRLLDHLSGVYQNIQHPPSAKPPTTPATYIQQSRIPTPTYVNSPTLSIPSRSAYTPPASPDLNNNAPSVTIKVESPQDNHHPITNFIPAQIQSHNMINVTRQSLPNKPVNQPPHHIIPQLPYQQHPIIPQSPSPQNLRIMHQERRVLVDIKREIPTSPKDLRTEVPFTAPTNEVDRRNLQVGGEVWRPW